MKSIAIFGASLNPVHNSHVNLVVSAIEKFGLDLVLVVPVNIPPHKSVDIQFHHRFEMARIAFGDVDKSIVINLDEGKSYSHLTVAKVKNLFRMKEDDRVSYILGEDSFLTLPSWENFDYLRKNCFFIVGRRHSGSPSLSATGIAPSVSPSLIKGVEYGIISKSSGDGSSSRCRRWMESGAFDSCISTPVADYIREHNLYVPKEIQTAQR